MTPVLAVELLEAALEKLRAAGAEHGDTYVEVRTSRSAALVDGRVEQASTGHQAGIGIRAVRGITSAFASSENLDGTRVLDTAHRVGEMLRAASGNRQPAPPAATSAAFAPDTRWEPVPWSSRVGLLRALDDACRGADRRIAQVDATLLESTQRIQVATTEGTHRYEECHRTRLRVRITAVDREGRRGSGTAAAGAGVGFDEFVGRIDAVATATEAARQATATLLAREAPAGSLALVVHHGAGGVLLHEACGHPLEGDALDAPSSAFHGRLGHPVAPPWVTLVDDHTLPDGWASEGFDDEGTDAQCTVLIDRERLASHLHDRQTASRHRARSTGNGRRASVRRVPVPRMSNTYLAAGEDTPEEILRATQDGVFARSFGGGTVDAVSGAFTLSVREGYRIRRGRLAEPLRALTVVGTGREVLTRIDRVGHDVAYAPVICGKDGQKAMASVGTPTIRISSVAISGG